MESELPEWAQSLPEELHTAPFLKDAENASQFAERLQHAASHMGNSVRIPGPDADSEAWSAFDAKLQEKIPELMRINLDDEDQYNALLTRLGRPGEAKDYGAGEDFGWLAEVAHATGLTKKQFETMVDKLGTVNESRNLQKSQEQQEALNQLWQEWGMAKPKRLENIEALAKLTDAPEAFREQIKDGNVGPEMLTWLHSLSEKFADVQNFIDDKNDQTNVMTPTEAKLQIQELLDSGKLFDTSKPDVIKAAQAKMVELQKFANPSAGTGLDGLIATGPQLQEMFEKS